MQQLLTALALGLFGVIAAIIGAVPLAIVSDPTLLSVSILNLLDVLSQVLAPLIGALITVIVWLHRRVSELEESRKKQQSTLYGIQGDTLAKGVTDEIRNLRGDVQELTQTLNNRVENLEERVTDLENKNDED